MKNQNDVLNISPEDLAFADILDDVFYYLPKRTWIYISYAALPLYAYGFSPERIDEIRRGGHPQDYNEENIIYLAVILTRAVSDSIRLKDTDKELDLIIKSSETANKFFDKETAKRVIKGLRQMLTETSVVDYYRQIQNEMVGKILKQINFLIIKITNK